MRVCGTVAAGLLMTMAALVAQQSELSAAAISLELQQSGIAKLYAIQFDAGPSIAKESEQTLASIGEVLQSDAALKLEIRVYTPGAGASGEALRLARTQAAAIKTYITDNLGVAGERLTTSGVVETTPIAGAPSAGRTPAQNGHVELVKKQ